MSRSASLGAPGEARSVLAIKPFQRLWVALSLAGLGEWLSLLAMMSLAAALTTESSGFVQAAAVGGVPLIRLAVWLLLGPVGAALSDRLDRRLTLVAADVLRGLLFVSVPIVGRLDWLLAATLLGALASVPWTSARESAVADLVPRKSADRAERVAMLTAYGTAPIAGVLFAFFAAVSTVLGGLVDAMAQPTADIALYLGAVAFLAAAAAFWTVSFPAGARPAGAHPAGAHPVTPAPPTADDVPTQQVHAVDVDPNELTAPIGTAATMETPALPDPAEQKAREAAAKAETRQRKRAERHDETQRRRGERRPDSESAPFSVIAAGLRRVKGAPLVRNLLLGMLAAAVAAGTVVGVGRIFVDRLGAGNAGFGVLFGAVFVGTALGVLAGPRTLRQFSRRRLFGLALAVSAVALLVTGLVPNMVLGAVLVLVAGLGAGLATAIGMDLIAKETADDARAGTDAFLNAVVRLALLASAGIAPLIAGAIGDHELALRGLSYDFLGTGAVLIFAAIAVGAVAAVCYSRMNGEPGDVPLLTELSAALRGVPVTSDKDARQENLAGTFIVLEGGEGAGKSTQLGQLSVWLRDEGFEVVTTREPGSTKLGMRLRALLLDREQTGMSSRSEALLYAADRADHVTQVILPALRRGAIVISDRYVDSTLAYQGAGRDLPVTEIARISDWATDGLMPELTVLLDLPAEEGLDRLGGTTDRIESESLEFHDRVRRGFRDLADRDPGRYLVVDARGSQEQITREIQRRLRPALPDPVPQESEAITGMMPVIKDEDESR